jgi:hypothetical protein
MQKAKGRSAVLRNNVVNGVRRMSSSIRGIVGTRFDTSRHYVSESLDAGRDYAADTARSLKNTANKAYVAGRAFVIAVDVAAQVKRMSDPIRKQPMLAGGAAFIMGCVAGLWTRRGSSSSTK